MFQTGVLLAKHDYMWIKVAIHVGGEIRGYIMVDIDKEIERLAKKMRDKK